MSYLKKISCLLLSVSLLTVHPQNPEEFKSTPYATAIALGMTGTFVAIAYGVHYYHNYYKVDCLSAQYLLEKLQDEITRTHSLLMLFATDALDSTITNAYPHFPFPYLTCHSQLEKSISELTYYKNALKRKISQKVFTNNVIVSEVSQLIDSLQYAQSHIEASSKYKNEVSQRGESTFSL